MMYTVGEMAKLLNIPGSTLRYYDKEGLLPFVERSSGGIRMFQEKDYEWLKVISCLKKAGMSLNCLLYTSLRGARSTSSSLMSPFTTLSSRNTFSTGKREISGSTPSVSSSFSLST